MSITATTEEPNDTITLQSCSPLRNTGKLLIKEKNVCAQPCPPSRPYGINCEYENWLAHKDALKRLQEVNFVTPETKFDDEDDE